MAKDGQETAAPMGTARDRVLAAVGKYTPSERVRQQIERTFVYHPPTGDQPLRYVAIRGAARALADVIAHTTPESREQSLALTHLETAVMMANAAIARNEP